MIESELKLFPGPFVYSEKIKNHSNIKEKLLPYIENDVVIANRTICKDNGAVVKTSFYDCYSNHCFLRYLEEIGVLNDIVWEPLDNCLSKLPFEVGSPPKTSTINTLWYNFFERGGKHGPHIHPSSFISGIYILHLEEKNPTVFFGSSLPSCPFHAFTYNTQHLTEGTVILFPSEMWHFVDEVKTKRITISFNITSYFD